MRQEEGSAYWDRMFAEASAHSPVDLWRAYMRQVYKRLIDDWFRAAPAGLGLKTDLFEEATSRHPVLPLLGPGSLGVDCSPVISRGACERLKEGHGPCRLVVTDLRCLPFRARAVSRILAGSSLDHFSRKDDIATALAEAARILAPNGILVLTLDNPHNPVVWLRNHLPFQWLYRLGLVPYYVGATYTRQEARRNLESLGFSVTDMTAVADVPRAHATWLVKLVEAVRGTTLRHLTARLLTGMECLERWPTRYQTGYYLAVRAEKRVD